MITIRNEPPVTALRALAGACEDGGRGCAGTAENVRPAVLRRRSIAGIPAPRCAG